MATGQVSPKVGKVIDIPAEAPTIGTATDLAQTGKVSVAFTAGSTTTGGPVFSYGAISNPGSITGTATSSPITVSGLTDGTAYTFTVAGANATGNGPSSAASNSATPTALLTSYQSIFTVTATGGETSITFSSIPSTFAHLQVRGVSRLNDSSDTGVWLDLKFNSDGSANYVSRTFYSERNTDTFDSYWDGYGNDRIYLNNSTLRGGTTANHYAPMIFDVHDYASITKNKTLRGYSLTNDNSFNSTTKRINMLSGMWSQTAAISSITIGCPTAFAANTTFALYGIKGA